ncbi:MAG: Fic/DOC family N-terminal domain-containing protein [Thermoplasmata archaeon]|nr:Fic/DOC family N-terminal domain-containing protein [Thermoplasmata archaeon]
MKSLFFDDSFTLDLPDDDILSQKEILRAHIDASRSLAELKGTVNTLPNSRILIDTLPLQEAGDSCGIENIVSSGDEIFKALTTREGKEGMGAREIIGYRSAIYYSRDADLSIGSIEGVCSRVLGRDIRIRKDDEQVYLKNPATGEIVFTPPSGNAVRPLMEQLLGYMNDPGIDPLLRMVISHSAFETIHPFMDGNGRTGRVLNVSLICKTGLLRDPILFLSGYLIENRREYYRQLRRINENRAKWDRWTAFMLEGVRTASVETLDRIERITSLYEKTCRECKGRTYYSQDLMDLVFSKVYVRIGDLENAGICERNTASKYLKQMESDGLLESEKVGRTVIFKNTGLMRELSFRNP